MAMINPQTTPITLATFKTITDSKGLFTTWTDIKNDFESKLPLNTEIMGVVTKSIEMITGDMIQLKNISTKNMQFFRDDLDNNNKLTQDKMVMMIYTDYMLNTEYSILDQKSAFDWDEILSESIGDMFISKNDYVNQRTLSELHYLNLALGEFEIIENADGSNIDPVTKEEDYKVYKGLAVILAKKYNNWRTKRTKYGRGFANSQVEWIISQDFSTNLLSGKTYDSASDKAFTEFEKDNQIHKVLNLMFRSSMYLGRDVEMAEFTKSGKVYNENSGTGNLMKPTILKNLIGLLFMRESLAFYGHNFVFSEQWKVNSRSMKVMTWSFRMDAAIKPVYARINKSILSGIPTEESYTQFDGTVVPAKDYSKLADFNKLRLELVQSQPQLYNKLFSPTGSPIASQDDLDAFYKERTVEWKYSIKAIAKRKALLSRKAKKQDKEDKDTK